MKGSNLLAFLGGAIAGAAVALLLAPQSGKETREQIKDFVDDSMDDVKDFTERAVNQVKKAVDKGAKEARYAINKGAATAKDVVCKGEKKMGKVLDEVEDVL